MTDARHTAETLADTAETLADTAATLADIGEAGLLLRIFPELPRGTRTILGPGDDAAIVSAEDGRIVVSTDVLVEGRHFRRDWSSGADVGWRAAMQNLADIAATGAAPSSLVAAPVAPSRVPVAGVLDCPPRHLAACDPYDNGSAAWRHRWEIRGVAVGGSSACLSGLGTATEKPDSRLSAKGSAPLKLLISP